MTVSRALKKSLIWLFLFYEKAKHQILLTAFGYSFTCKHRPTCTQYTLQQMQQHGTITGFLRGLKRVAQCW